MSTNVRHSRTSSRVVYRGSRKLSMLSRLHASIRPLPSSSTNTQAARVVPSEAVPSLHGLDKTCHSKPFAGDRVAGRASATRDVRGRQDLILPRQREEDLCQWRACLAGMATHSALRPLLVSSPPVAGGRRMARVAYECSMDIRCGLASSQPL